MARQKTDKSGSLSPPPLESVPEGTRGDGKKLLRAIDRALDKMPRKGQELPSLEDLLAETGFVALPH